MQFSALHGFIFHGHTFRRYTLEMRSSRTWHEEIDDTRCIMNFSNYMLEQVSSKRTADHIAVIAYVFYDIALHWKDCG